MPEITLDDVPGELRRSTLRLTGAQVIVSATIPLNAAIGATEAVHLSHHAALSGTSVGVAMLASVSSLYVLGRLADRLGRRPVLGIGLCLLALGCAITGVAVAVESYPLFVAGVVWALFNVVKELWAASERVLTAFIALLGVFVKTLPHVVLAGLVAFGGAWVMNNVNPGSWQVPAVFKQFSSR